MRIRGTLQVPGGFVDVPLDNGQRVRHKLDIKKEIIYEVRNCHIINRVVWYCAIADIVAFYFIEMNICGVDEDGTVIIRTDEVSLGFERKKTRLEIEQSWKDFLRRPRALPIMRTSPTTG